MRSVCEPLVRARGAHCKTAAHKDDGKAIGEPFAGGAALVAAHAARGPSVGKWWRNGCDHRAAATRKMRVVPVAARRGRLALPQRAGRPLSQDGRDKRGRARSCFSRKATNHQLDDSEDGAEYCTYKQDTVAAVLAAFFGNAGEKVILADVHDIKKRN